LILAGADSRIAARDSRDPLMYTVHFWGDEHFEMFKFLYDFGEYHEQKAEPHQMSLLHKTVMTDNDIVVTKCLQYMIQNGSEVLDATEASYRYRKLLP